MSTAILDLVYGNSFKPGLTPSSIPIGATSYLSGITVNGNNFQFGTVGNYQVDLFVDSDFTGSDGSRIVVDLFNVTKNQSVGNFQLNANSGEASWMLPVTVTDTNDVYTVRAVTFSSLPGTINAVRIYAMDLGGGGGGGLPALPLNSVQFNDAGAFGGSANFLWVNANSQAQIIGGGDGTFPALVISQTQTDNNANGSAASIGFVFDNALGFSTDSAAMRISASIADASPASLTGLAVSVANINSLDATPLLLGQSILVNLQNTGFPGANEVIGLQLETVVNNGYSDFLYGIYNEVNARFSGGTGQTMWGEYVEVNDTSGSGSPDTMYGIHIKYNLDGAGVPETFYGLRIESGSTSQSPSIAEYGVFQQGTTGCLNYFENGINCDEWLQFGTTAVLSDANRARLRYNAGALEVSLNGAAYAAVGGGSLTGFTTASLTALGIGAGDSVTTATGNTAIGVNAGTALTTTLNGNNVLVGLNAGDALTTGLRNVAIGANALGAATAVNDTVAIGSNAGLVCTSNENVFVGSGAGQATAASSSANVMIGFEAGSVNTTATDNTFIGHRAAYRNTGGTRNTVIGSSAGSGNTASYNDNVLLGVDAGNALTSGGTNVAVGRGSMPFVTTGGSNVAIGNNAQAGAVGSASNVVIGAAAGTSVGTGGSQNVIIGADSGSFGSGAVSNMVLIGYQAGNSWRAAGHVAIGSNAGDASSTNTGGTFVGFNAGTAATGADNTVVGYAAGDAFTTGARNSIFGKDAGGGSGTAMSDNAFFGYQAGLLNTANQNVFIGSSAGAANTSSTGHVHIGYQAGLAVTGANNTIVGHQAGDGFTTGVRNCLFGVGAGGSASATAMSDTVMIGYQAGLLNTANENVYIGSNAGPANSANTGLVLVGYQAGLTLSTGSNNTVIGHQAGGSNSQYSSCVFIGTGADSSTNGISGSVVLGSGALATASNQFVAGASASAISDIYFGKGVTNAAATACTINGTGGSGSDIAGANLQLAGGKGTGTAEPGLVVIKYPLKTTTGTTLQSLSTQSFPVSTTMFTGNASAVTVSSATAPTLTTLVGTVTGSRSLEGGLLRVGRVIRVRAGGVFTTSATPPTWDIRVMKGATTLHWFNTAFTPLAPGCTGFPWTYQCDILVRAVGASGSTVASGRLDYFNAAAATVAQGGNYGNTVNTTTTENLDFQIAFGAATGGNSFSCEFVSFEILS